LTPERPSLEPIYTIGHGTLTQGAFVELADRAGIGRIVDIRSYPTSRHNPQFGQDQMSQWLPDANIAYEWRQNLGGRRKPLPTSRHEALRHRSFRAYADHMDTTDFLDALAELVTTPGRQAVMCSETLWWRCHRRLLADHLVLLENIEVLHVMHDGNLSPHKPTQGVRRDATRLTYDVLDPDEP
jgi:uncharacterized protein (DUF488 family)